MQTVLFVTDLHAGSRVHAFAGVREALLPKGYRVEEVELIRLTEPLSKVIGYWKPVGCILEGSGKINVPPQTLRKLPVVHLDPQEAALNSPQTFTVMNDAVSIAGLASDELLRCGCTSFAYIGWTNEVLWSRQREKCFVARLAEKGWPCQVMNDPWTLGNKADFARRLKPFLKKLPRGCGIFTASDDFAAVVLDVCQMEGYSVPGDFMIVGVDDEPSVCDYMCPTLTSIKPDFQKGGFLAAQLLLKRLENPDCPPEKILYSPVGLTPRRSTRRMSKGSAKVGAAMDYIRREACKGIHAADVIAFMGMRERTAEIRFKEVTGSSMTEEITLVRLARVYELLRNPKQAIEPIANLCGWGSPIYLKRLFKQRTGLTLRQWRQKYLAENPKPRYPFEARRRG